jgi:hypothetical protein
MLGAGGLLDALIGNPASVARSSLKAVVKLLHLLEDRHHFEPLAKNLKHTYIRVVRAEKMCQHLLLFTERADVGRQDNASHERTTELVESLVKVLKRIPQTTITQAAIFGDT